MKRREFIVLLGGAAAAWPLSLPAQQPERMPRIGFLTALTDDDLTKARIKALIEGLRDLGWIEGRNFRIDYRFAVGKMLELLKETVPRLARAAVIFNPATGAYIPAYLRSLEARSPAVVLSPAPVHEVAEIDAVIAALAREPDHGIVVAPEPFSITHRKSIFASAEQHRVAAIYYYRSYVAEGVLMSYGADQFDIFRRSASYIDRILKSARPADLPVQQPVKYEFAINLKTAKKLGLDVSWFLQQRADEVIE